MCGSALEPLREAAALRGSSRTMALERFYAFLPVALDWRDKPQPLAAWRRAPKKNSARLIWNKGSHFFVRFCR